MANFLLVHGTSDGSWIWRSLSPLLRVAGHEVYMPTLTGLGASSHLLPLIDRITLATHIQDVTNMLFYEDLSDVVLVGNSYGGMVITGVAAKEPRRLAHIVYLDAYVPLEGENEMVLWPPEELARVKSALAKGERFRPLPPNFTAFLGITDPKIADWMQARMTPHPISTYEDPPPPFNPESSSIPRTFIHCTQGPTAAVFARFASRARDLGWKVQEVAAGHAAMVTNPRDLANILLEVAKGENK